MSWVGFDLDGTLAKYDGWKGSSHIGEPIKPIVDILLGLSNSGKEVRIVTARAVFKEHIPYIQHWCKEHLGRIVPITDKKDFEMEVLYDDRAIQVEKNTGRIIGDK